MSDLAKFDELEQGFDVGNLLAAKGEPPSAKAPLPDAPPMALSDSPQPFFGQREPMYVLQEEKPQHRAIIYLAAQGNTDTEIAQKLGFTTTMVSYVRKQKWAAEQIAQIMAEQGGDMVREVLTGAALKAAQRLIEIAETAKGEETKRKANNDILDRVFGKAQQFVHHHNMRSEDLDKISDQELLAMLPSGTTTHNG